MILNVSNKKTKIYKNKKMKQKEELKKTRNVVLFIAGILMIILIYLVILNFNINIADFFTK